MLRPMRNFLRIVIGHIINAAIMILRFSSWFLRQAKIHLLPIKYSIMAGVAAAFLGLMSMGALGILLFYAAGPVLIPVYGNPDDFRGDWVWPVFIGTGMMWGVCFPLAGLLNRRLEQNGWSRASRRAIYALILWLGAIGIWIVAMTFPSA